ncbi:alkaline phosphatase D family protein [Candidatus Odyssella acanthamoebae]|uniref:PhoD-like phosphatase metallophosphatase domain-containing protein n=1 Tax=Candidatus Odyssella acanthamoebae TaxID=91604 RepID=A0A077ARI6_9PROT|nr:alkaline phosphatase D family protein [Candidatus Paracaedibacter acanthamoebae]AIK95817.1 hypothetical protein ID47_02310 [Candidatus Paracaedibacter acanthamoebae]
MFTINFGEKPMIRQLRHCAFIASLTYSCLATAVDTDDILELTLEKPKAVIMGEVAKDRIRFNVCANPTSELCYGALQYRLAGEEDWENTITFPLARSQHYSDAVDIKELKPENKYEYRIGTFHIRDQSILPNVKLIWNDQSNPNYEQDIFYSYEDFVGKKDLSFLFGSCQYDGPLLDKLEKSPLALLNLLMKIKPLRNIGFFTKLTKLPGYKSKISNTQLGIMIELLALAEQEGTFIRTDDSEIFKTIREYAEKNNIQLRGFMDMGDTYYRDWLNIYGGAQNTEEVYALILNAITTAGRYEIQKTMPTLVQIDDHAFKDNFTRNDLIGQNYSLFADSCWRMADMVQRQMNIYDPETKQIGYRWSETSLWGLPVFIGDFRSEMIPGLAKISTAQQTALEKFLIKWGSYPKVILSQVPIGPDDTSKDTSDKWGDAGYQITRNKILNYLYSNKIKNTFWLGGDIHSGLFADVVHTSKPINENSLRSFPRVTDETESEVSMKNIVLAEAVASPFNWPIQFESMVLDPFIPLGESDKGHFCVVNQSSLVKKNHGGIFKLSDDGMKVEIALLTNSPDNPSGEVVLKKVYQLVPYESKM